MHNHEPSCHPSAHSIHQQLSGDTSHLQAFQMLAIASKKIQTLVWQSGSLATRQDVYNQIAAIWQDSYEGQSPIHALANQLDKGFCSWIQFASDGHVTAVLLHILILLSISKHTLNSFFLIVHTRQINMVCLSLTWLELMWLSSPSILHLHFWVMRQKRTIHELLSD